LEVVVVCVGHQVEEFVAVSVVRFPGHDRLILVVFVAVAVVVEP
jgi:hypothetical protein